MRMLLVLTLLLFLVAIGLFAAAVYNVIDNAIFFSHSVATSGTIIGFDEYYKGPKHNSSYTPIIRFNTAQGQTIVFTSTIGTDSKMNDTVKVYYNSTDPQEARLDSVAGFWVLPIASTTIGIVFCLLPSFFCFRYYRRFSYLIKHGQKIYANLETVEKRPSIKRGYYYVAVFQGFNESINKKQCFESESLQFDPLSLLGDEPFDALVYVDPHNPQSYYLDSKPLQKLKTKR